MPLHLVGPSAAGCVDGRRYKPFGPANYPAETEKLRAMTELRDDYIHNALAGKSFDLAAAAKRQVRTYSGGMRRRLDIAASIIAAPELLFLDEPTTGLDPRSRSELWEVLRGLVREGTTLLLTTQYLEEADQLADDIVVIDKGRVIASGTPTQLKDGSGRASVVNDRTRRSTSDSCRTRSIWLFSPSITFQAKGLPAASARVRWNMSSSGTKP